MAYVSNNANLQSQVWGAQPLIGGGNWGSQLNGFFEIFVGPPMFGPSVFGMDPFGAFSAPLMTRMLMSFLHGGAPFSFHCPCQEATGLYQPYMTMPYAPEMMEQDGWSQDPFSLPYEDTDVPPPQPQKPQPRILAEAQPQVQVQAPTQAQAQVKTQPQAQAQAQAQVKTQPQAQAQVKTQPKPQPQVKPQPTKSNFDASKTATSLNQAMNGGLFGAGTDEDAVFKALQGRTPEEVKAIRASYKEHYKRDLDADLKSELSGSDLSRAQSLMKGKAASADATALRQAISGAGTDEGAIFKTLEQKTPEQRQQIATEYRNQTGRTLQSDLKADLSGAQLDRATALLKGDTAKAEAAKLNEAMSGAGTDQSAIIQVFEGKKAEERQAVADSYRKTYGKDLNESLKSELSGTDLTQAQALMEGDDAKADAVKLRNAMAGAGTDESAIHAVLDGKSEQERAKIAAEYQKAYGIDLKKALAQEMSGNDLSKANTLLSQGKISDAQALKFAIEGAGTDEEAIKAVLKGKTREQIADLQTAYRKETGRDLQADLDSELTGRDLFDAEQDMLGKATTAVEALQRLNEAHQYERGGQGNSFGRTVVDLFSDQGTTLDRNVSAANQSAQRYRELQAQGRDTEAAAEKERLERLMGYSHDDIESVREAKDSAADMAGTVAATAAGVAVIAVTAGTASPLVAAGLAAATGGSARVLVAGAIQGDAYGSEQGFADFAKGAIDGGTAIIGAGTGKAASAAATKGASEVAEAAARNRLMSTGVRQAIKDGVVGGAVGGGAAGAVDERTWEGGLAQGLQNVTASTVLGGVAGGVAGGVVTRLRETPLRGVGDDLAGGGRPGREGLDPTPFKGGDEPPVTVKNVDPPKVADDLAVERATQRAALREAEAEAVRHLQQFPDIALKRRFTDIPAFRDIKASEQLEILRMAQRHTPKHRDMSQAIDGLRNSSVEANLRTLVRTGRMRPLVGHGDTLINNLRKLETQTMYPGLNRVDVFQDVLATVAKPGRIQQGNRGTCSATSVQYMHARKDPSDYVRVMGEMTSDKGSATLLSGKSLHLNQSSIAHDDSGRRISDRLYQDSAMNHASDDSLRYDNTVSNDRGYLGGHVDKDGKVTYTGLYDTDAHRLLNDTFGAEYQNVGFSDDEISRIGFSERLAATRQNGEVLHVAMKWGKDGDKHAYHALVAEGMDDKFVYLRNPWGKGDTGGADALPRTVVDREGRVKIDHQTFFGNLQSYQHQPLTHGDRVLAKLRTLLDDSQVEAGNPWREASFYEGNLRNTFADFDFDRIPENQKDSFYRELLQRAQRAVSQDNPAELAKLREVFQSYGVRDYDPMQIINGYLD